MKSYAIARNEAIYIAVSVFPLFLFSAPFPEEIKRNSK